MNHVPPLPADLRPAAPEKAPDPATGAVTAKVVADALRDQKQRQERLRHVQEFMTSPVFIDMTRQPITVSDGPEAVAERKRDLVYRINVVESVLALLIEELDLLDRVISAPDASSAA